MKLACVQSDVVFNDPAANAAKILEHLEHLAQENVQLAIFPEAFLTGYCVDSLESALSIALEVTLGEDGTISHAPDSVQAIVATCARLEMHCIAGFAGKQGGRVYNGALLIRPNGKTSLYKKSHLPYLGLDRFVDPGSELPVFETTLGKIGILICYDQRVPEAARVIALNGADLIVLPTNWPEGAETSADVMCIARAAENRVFYAACNRVGTEHGFRFIGRSKVVSPTGKVLACAGDGEETLIVNVDLAEARQKRAVVRPGEYEWSVFDCRRPELYSDIVEPVIQASSKMDSP